MRSRPTFLRVAALCCGSLSGSLIGQSLWQTNGNNTYVPSGVNVGIGTAGPEARLHVEGLSVLHVDDWGNDTLVFRGQKSTANQWGEYAIRTSYTGLTFRNTQTGNTLLHLGAGGGASANIILAQSGGNVGIGIANPQYKLAVNGTIGTKEVIVTNTGWADYVFKPNYRLRPLSEVGAFIQTNGRLPDMPSEKEVQEKGVGLAEMQVKLLAKIEELTLHVIRMDERNGELERQNRQLQKQMTERLSKLESRAAKFAR